MWGTDKQGNKDRDIQSAGLRARKEADGKRIETRLWRQGEKNSKTEMKETQSASKDGQGQSRGIWEF